MKRLTLEKLDETLNNGHIDFMADRKTFACSSESVGVC